MEDSTRNDRVTGEAAPDPRIEVLNNPLIFLRPGADQWFIIVAFTDGVAPVIDMWQ